MRDHQPITLEKFNGLWSRGNVEETPLDHFSECNNLEFVADHTFKTRNGVGLHQQVMSPLQNILRIYTYATADNPDTLLVLTIGGTIYHVLDDTTVLGPILTVPGMTDFGFAPFGTRAYITPFSTEQAGDNYRERGLQNEYLYVYKGDGTAARRAGGAPPISAIVVANGAAGNTDAGDHVFGVLYETDTGYLTAPAGFVMFTTSAANSVSFSSVPVSPDSFVTKRHIVATKVIQNYAGDLTGYQFFFIPGGTINDNTTTTLSDISFFDADLIEDASHLLDNFTNIKAGVGLCIYHNRMCLWTQYDNTNVVRVSEVGEPEAFNQVDGLIEITPDGNWLTNAAELRDILYIMKRSRTYGYVDNGDVPSSWPQTVVDNAIGCGVHGIATVIDSGSSNVDYLIVSSFNGLILFNGKYILPELSWKVSSLWSQQDFKNLNRVIQPINDSVRQIVYCLLADNSILYGEYSNGFNPKDIRWCPWTFEAKINTLALINISELLLGAGE